MKFKVKFKRMKNLYGLCDPVEKTIFISTIKNKTINDYIDTFIHETLHATFPNLTEEKVFKLTSKLIQKKDFKIFALKHLFLSSRKKEHSFSTSEFKKLFPRTPKKRKKIRR